MEREVKVSELEREMKVLKIRASDLKTSGW